MISVLAKYRKQDNPCFKQDAEYLLNINSADNLFAIYVKKTNDTSKAKIIKYTNIDDFFQDWNEIKIPDNEL